MVKVYISGYNKYKEEVSQDLKSQNFNTWSDVRSNIASPEIVKRADALVLVTNNNAFKNILISNLNLNTKIEVEIASKNNIPIYLCYKKKNGFISYYKTQIIAGYIDGISGTFDDILNLKTKINVKIKKDIKPVKTKALNQFKLDFEENLALLI